MSMHGFRAFGQTCPPGQVLNPDTNICECPEGSVKYQEACVPHSSWCLEDEQWDSAKGACVVIPGPEPGPGSATQEAGFMATYQWWIVSGAVVALAALYITSRSR